MANTKQAYSQKLLDPRWQKKRLEILNRDKFSCQRCYNDKNTLHVHHKRYFSDKEPWDIDNRFLITLCDACHQEETDLMPEVTHDIVQILKERFFARDIKDIATGLLNVPTYLDSAVTASIIEYWLSDAENFNTLGRLYFEYLAKENGNDTGDMDDLPFPSSETDKLP